MPWEVLRFVGSTQSTPSWFSSTRVRVSQCWNYSTTAFDYQLNPPEAEHLSICVVINTSHTVSSAVVIWLVKSLKRSDPVWRTGLPCLLCWEFLSTRMKSFSTIVIFPSNWNGNFLQFIELSFYCSPDLYLL